MYTEVVCGDGLASGRTIIDIFGMLMNGSHRQQALAQHVYVATDVDVDAFWNMMVDALTLANSKNAC